MDRSRYLINDPFGKIVLRIIDAFLPICHEKNPITRAPNKILVANLAHLGDVVITTAMLVACKELWPQAEIGMLVGSWTHSIVQEHPLVQRVHLIDHWKLNPTRMPLIKKMQQYYRTASTALDQIKQQQYDLALDVYPFFPNAIFWLWKARIPYRAGWASGGFGGLLTHPLEKIDRTRGIDDNYRDLLLLITGEKVQVKIQPYLPSVCASAKISRILPKSFQDKKYLVFHMGTKEPAKMWLKDNWRALAKKCIEKGFFIVFTGLGKEESRCIDEVIHQLPNVFNAANHLNWQEFVAVIQKAKHVVSVDSSAGHVAAAHVIPTTIVFTGINPPAFCRPLNPNAKLLFKQLACVPCLHSKGCPTMNCIRKITPNEVFTTIITDELF
jgi:ADP-heptose:LPS heptosyltransferase